MRREDRSPTMLTRRAVPREIPDASRLLGHAAIVLQRALGISAEPLLADLGTAGVIAVSRDAVLVVAGLSERFGREDLGAARAEIAQGAAPPVLLVRPGR